MGCQLIGDTANRLHLVSGSEQTKMIRSDCSEHRVCEVSGGLVLIRSRVERSVEESWGGV